MATTTAVIFSQPTNLFLPNDTATESYLPDDVAFVSQLASSAHQRHDWAPGEHRNFATTATQAHADPEQARLNSLFWPPDAHADPNPAPLAAT